MKLNRTGWRNLLRNKRRTIISAFSVAFGVLLSITFTASGDYSYTNLIDTSATMGFGHLTIEPPGYNDSPSLSKRLADTDRLCTRLNEIPAITAAYVRIMGQAMFASGVKNVGGMFIAVDPARETAAHNIFIRSIQQGSIFSAGANRGVVVGARMAEKLKLRLGKKLIFTLTDKNGEIVSEISRITGIFRTGEDSVDGSVVLLPINLLRKTLSYENGAATIIAIFIKDQRRAEDVRRLAAAGIEGGAGNDRPPYEILTWKQTQAELAGLIAVDRAGNYLLQFLVGLLIAAGIFNTLLMSVMERRREFGMMMAIGMSPMQVVRLVLIESLWLGIMGLLLGILLTTPWYIYMSKVGLDLSRYIGEDYSASGVLMDPVLKFRLFKESAVAILSGVFALTMIAGLYPACRAGRITPVESLKNQI